MNWLNGKKTIIGAVAGGLLWVAYALGYVDQTTAEILAGLITMWTGIAIRAAIQKSGPAVPAAKALTADR